MLRVLVLLSLLLLTNVSPCSAVVPALFREPSFNAATLAQAVNHYVAIGEESAVKELATLAAERDHIRFPAAKPPLAKVDDPPRERWIDIYERIGWVCRVLYVSKGQEPLRPQRLGVHAMLPYELLIERFPLYPVVLSGNTYFVLSEGYSGSGIPEGPVDYIAYCRENGTFRKMLVPVPTRAQAMKDAAALRQSEAWKAIRWHNGSPQQNDRLRDEWIGKFIVAQAEAIPTQAR